MLRDKLAVVVVVTTTCWSILLTRLWTPEGCVFGVPQHPTLYVAQQVFQSCPCEQEEPIGHLKGLAPGHTGTSACVPGLSLLLVGWAQCCAHLGHNRSRKGSWGPSKFDCDLKGKEHIQVLRADHAEVSEGQACFPPCVMLVAHLALLQGCEEGVAGEGAVLPHICFMSSCCQLIRHRLHSQVPQTTVADKDVSGMGASQ